MLLHGQLAVAPLGRTAAAAHWSPPSLKRCGDTRNRAEGPAQPFADLVSDADATAPGTGLIAQPGYVATSPPVLQRLDAAGELVTPEYDGLQFRRGFRVVRARP